MILRLFDLKVDRDPLLQDDRVVVVELQGQIPPECPSASTASFPTHRQPFVRFGLYYLELGPPFPRGFPVPIKHRAIVLHMLRRAAVSWLNRLFVLNGLSVAPVVEVALHEPLFSFYDILVEGLHAVEHNHQVVLNSPSVLVVFWDLLCLCFEGPIQ